VYPQNGFLPRKWTHPSRRGIRERTAEAVPASRSPQTKLLKGLAALAPGPQPARQRMPRLQAGRGKFGRESPRGGALRLLVVEQNLDGVETISEMAFEETRRQIPGDFKAGQVHLTN
jgi:hypothetical protein